MAPRPPDRCETNRRPTRLLLGWLLPAAAALVLCGCTTLGEYIHNGFKVGPNYCKPPAPVAEHWIDADDVRVHSEECDDTHWWMAFNDPILDDLVHTAYQQNLSLREAGFRVLAYRYQLGIATGNLFPQTQDTVGSYERVALSKEVANRQFIAEAFYSQWNYGFNLAWELDFWGRFRRAIESARDDLDASVENYDDVLVTLIGDVASEYVTMRTLEQRIVYARENVALQRISFKIARARFQGGQVSEVDVNQSQSDLSSVEALVPQLEIQLREANNRLCILLGIPPEELLKKFGSGTIPAAPPAVCVGIPADLLRRRPDVRRAERQAASQSAQIGVAASELYPHMTINGALGWSAEEYRNLFAGNAFAGNISPGFTWNILNYGRLLNNVRLQDARFQALIAAYQNTVLQAGQEVENGLVRFIKAHQTTRFLTESANAAQRAVNEAVAQYKGGLVDFNRVALLQEKLVERQEDLAKAQGDIAQGLIHVYRALGGGWQIRCAEDGNGLPPVPAAEPPHEPLPTPKPLPVEEKKAG